MRKLIANLTENARLSVKRWLPAIAHFFTSGSSLHHTWKTGDFPFALRGRIGFAGSRRAGSRVRLPEPCQSDFSFPRREDRLLHEQLQGKLLSAYQVN